ncbi:hypothetical protein N7499_009549 [Penicillium canescens]|uniref:Uncharacterized protein n=1 Tax=Penicillium canescens TaxID=5083 RepID=A0AAD6INA7_PENCN|nr:uncharacterized protein N7446_008425 [Penicillium canescens]KAJ6019287.1 hypothetical protein N7522_001354 [Penicillium canescens]KAJ6033284.1 hypothetical protein N7444_011055 [Penicillium canescens]KAJ6057526.1 hypothetical protein N7460_000800 [Penicillium canescens]KAJ6058842.1 hypothetical protein N7446_008425 [Penicillium canescens]KAJ6071535.1 hypothetical protein N7499_009549 [Penicillium canescens]
MSGQSSVGNRTVYEAGDQRNEPVSELQERARYAEGQTHSHQNLDSKDGRSIANKLASQEHKKDPSHHHNDVQNQEAELSKQDPTKPAKVHGNAPSKGAQVDAELQADDEQRLREKGIKH